MARRKKRNPRKLTLRLEGEVIDAAKDLAARQGRSLSDMVEEYFRDAAIRDQARVREAERDYDAASNAETAVEDEPPAWREYHPRLRAALRAELRGDDPDRAADKVSLDEENEWLETLSPNVRALLGIAKPAPGEKEITREDYRRYLEEKHR